MLRPYFYFVIAAFFSTVISTAGFTQGTPLQPTPAQRQNMSAMHKKIAEMHVKMAACLESDKSPAQCRQEMQDACSSNFGGTCPMMGMGKMGGRGRNAMGGGRCLDWMTAPPNETPVPAKSPAAK